ncbi:MULTISPECIES: hypothetical protein [Streptomyces]|uniref:Deoxyribose-phosphate aldolase n=1 Tax=Streptomyces lonegramiae TaxID=3075524 RepID=A0ABU2X5H5_9ACTN|nr:hypothetical protein [Streptomyces sp. DSM 41529]MDT0541159.1 hypothetical protein [Streptomyces sp. DSM 41529]
MSASHSDDSVAKLASRLTLEQKVAQLCGLSVMNLTDRKKSLPAGARSPI